MSSCAMSTACVRQTGRLRLARSLVQLPGSLLACPRAELGASAAGALLHLQQRFAHTVHVAAPVGIRDTGYDVLIEMHDIHKSLQRKSQ